MASLSTSQQPWADDGAACGLALEGPPCIAWSSPTIWLWLQMHGPLDSQRKTSRSSWVLGEVEDSQDKGRRLSVSHNWARKPAVKKKVKPLFKNSANEETCPWDTALRCYFSNFPRVEKIGNFPSKIKCMSAQPHPGKGRVHPQDHRCHHWCWASEPGVESLDLHSLAN